MKTPVALDYGGGSGSDEDDDDEEEVPSTDDEGVTTTTKEEEEEEEGANDAEDVGQQGRRRVEQQRLLASQKLAFVERVFMTTTASSSDEDSFERACREARLTRDDFIDACGERSRMGACGWCLCDRAPVAASSSPTTTKTTTTKRFEIDAGARKVRDAAFVRGFCSREHLSSAEALAIRLGKSADAVSAARGAATKSAAPRGGEADVLKEQVVERRRSVGSAAQQAKPGAASGSSASLLESDRMARAMSVDGFLSREARKKVEAQRETEKKETQQQQQQQRGARSRAVTWNESEIQEIEASSAAKKEERAAADVATGVFYFDTYGEGKKPKEGEFIPSIGGRFAEGQLRTEPRETGGGGEMTLDVRAAVDEEQNGEPVETTTTTTTTTKDAADGVAEVARKMLAATLTANPIPGFSDGDEGFDDDDDEMSSIASSSEEEERMMAATAAPSVSQFGITWMAIDNMVTEATFALSRADGSFIDMLPSRDKYTTSVSEAWNENLAKYVPELCVKLGISSERRRIEQGLTTLLRTFSFERAVPPFTEQRWLFVTMLFVRVLVSSELVALGDVDLLSSEAAIAVRDAAGSTSEEVELLGQRLHGQGVS